MGSEHVPDGGAGGGGTGVGSWLGGAGPHSSGTVSGMRMHVCPGCSLQSRYSLVQYYVIIYHKGKKRSIIKTQKKHEHEDTSTCSASETLYFKYSNVLISAQHNTRANVLVISVVAAVHNVAVVRASRSVGVDLLAKAAVVSVQERAVAP